MKLRTRSNVVVAAVCGALVLAQSAAAEAQPGDSSVYSSRPRDAAPDLVPNVDLIASGLFTFAVPYLASVAVATESDRKADYYLYTPVAGPWLDLSNREDCPATGSCAHETAYRILLVADGVLQGFGALQVLSGLLIPVPRSTSAHAATSATVRVAPSVSRGAAGLTAFGRF